ncbi:MAG: acyl-CoA dehydrogenase C-terminal domain-containing protein [Alphaproteobacteria bacterium]|nr:acyl-CoA dehydrogenase C-terminal domain-containing protein [Alphaproteobacteria bacterium]
MPGYQAPLRDMRFLLNEVLRIDSYSNLAGFAEAPPDVIDAILEGGARFASDVLQPLNSVGDRQGCRRNPDASVVTPDGFIDAYRQMVEGGWMTLSSDPEYGGQGLPRTIALVFAEMCSSANMAFAMYPGLTHGAYSAIHAGASDEQKRMYLPKLATGEWAGTMNLTEPQCGTDLGLIKTKAVSQPDGSYRITGQKIWISGGEQDLSANIIHLVLARIEGAPEGVKGISLFIVPKVMVGADGSLGAHNSLECGGLEEKMGIHGNATCVMHYDGATGHLVGEAHKGMRIMFVMMNEARLGVGVQGLAQAEVAYQNAASFARDRTQGRSITGVKAPDKAADPIIVHPDVRRMLMDCRAFIEGARAFAYWTALQGDLLHVSPDEKVREKADDRMALMTPVIKAFLTDRGFKAASDALQLHGGAGFTREQGIEQFVRDARIAMIYEGTNSIQALDLVGRKLAANGGRAVFAFFTDLEEFCALHEADEAMKPHVAGVRTAAAQLKDGTMWLMQNGMSNFDNAGASSHDYLQLFGLTALALMWAQMAKAALDQAGSGDSFYADKLATADYFFQRVLPDATSHLAKVKTGAGSVMALRAEAF